MIYNILTKYRNAALILTFAGSNATRYCHDFTNASTLAATRKLQPDNLMVDNLVFQADQKQKCEKQFRTSRTASQLIDKQTYYLE